MRCHISGCENVKVSISPPGLVRSNTVRARAVNNGKKRGKTATRSFLPFTHYSQNVKPRKIETLANGRKNKVYSKWIPFGRHIMIAVKHNWGKESRGEADIGARTHRQTDMQGMETDRPRETPAVASPAVIIVLTFKWKALTIGAGWGSTRYANKENTSGNIS